VTGLRRGKKICSVASCRGREEKGRNGGRLSGVCLRRSRGGDPVRLACSSKGLAGFRSGKGADMAEAAAGRERTGERSATHGP
jgi:hypothetical protein